MLFLAIEVKNHQNIGTYLRSAVAFGADAIIVIGSTKFGSHGAHGAQKHINIVHFYTWSECSIFAKLMNSKFYGIDIASQYTDFNSHISPEQMKYTGSAIFIVNISGKLFDHERTLCSSIISLNIPSNSTLNYDCIIGITMHYYALQIFGDEIKPITGEKFEINHLIKNQNISLTTANINSNVIAAKEHYLSQISLNDSEDINIFNLFSNNISEEND